MAFDFSDIEVTPSVLIVDALNLAFRWKHQKATSFADAYVATVFSLATSYQAKEIIIAADKGSSSYRKGIFPDYKGNRKERFENQTEEEKEYFEKFIAEYELCLDFCERDDMTVLRYDKVEADDIAAYLVKYRKELLPHRHIWLVSSDKDWDLLIDDDVSRFSYVTRKETTVDTWSDHYPVTREQYMSFKCLDGDAGDNIPGVPGIGPKRASTILAEYGDVFELYSSLPLPGKAKYIQNLNEFGDQLMLNVELMDLITYCDDAIGSDNTADIKEQLSAKV